MWLYQLLGILKIINGSYTDTAVPGGHTVHYRPSGEKRPCFCSAGGVSYQIEVRWAADNQEKVPKGHTGL